MRLATDRKVQEATFQPQAWLLHFWVERNTLLRNFLISGKQLFACYLAKHNEALREALNFIILIPSKSNRPITSTPEMTSLLQAALASQSKYWLSKVLATGTTDCMPAMKPLTSNRRIIWMSSAFLMKRRPANLKKTVAGSLDIIFG